jgi:hypothetical protein
MHSAFKMMSPLPADAAGTADRRRKLIETVATAKAKWIAHQAPDRARAA